MAAQYENPSEYISHHLTSLLHPIGPGGFWTLNVDSIIVSIILGFVGLGFCYWIAKGATTGVPNKKQAFVELLFSKVASSRTPSMASAWCPPPMCPSPSGWRFPCGG